MMLANPGLAPTVCQAHANAAHVIFPVALRGRSHYYFHLIEEGPESLHLVPPSGPTSHSWYDHGMRTT